MIVLEKRVNFMVKWIENIPLFLIPGALTSPLFWGRREEWESWGLDQLIWVTHKTASTDTHKQRLVFVTGLFLAVDRSTCPVLSCHYLSFLIARPIFRLFTKTWFIQSWVNALNHNQASQPFSLKKMDLTSSSCSGTTQKQKTHKNMLLPSKTTRRM